MFKKYPVYYLLYGGFSSFMIVVLVVVIWLAYSLTSLELAKNTSYYQQNVLNEIYSKIDIQLRSIEQISLAASRNPVLAEYALGTDDFYIDHKKSADLQAFLANITNSSPMIISIQFYTKHAVPVYSQTSVTLIDEEEAKKESWYQAISKSDFSWIGERPIKLFNGDFTVISFARKVYSNTGQYSGLLLLNIKAPEIQSLVKGETPETTRILLDSGGRVITSVGDPQFAAHIHDFLPTLNNESGFLKINPKGYRFKNAKDHLMVWSKHADWSLVEFTPWQQIASVSVRNAFILSIVGALTIFLSFFFSLFFSRQFVKPIRLLLQEMGRYTANINKTKITLPEDYCNEYGVLFSGYRKLIERIQELYMSLEKQYDRQKKAEIKALQAMINPHFLYNTLDQINWMALGAGQDKISNVLELVGRMFRIGLSNGETLILMEDELMHASCYIQIQQLRWEEGLTVKFAVPDELKTFYIPKLTLQPFLENAIMHGFEGRTAGSIEISAVRDKESIVITIWDNGAGLRSDWNKKRKSNTGGYGIRNVKERFEAFFGPAYGIQINNDAVRSGVTVTIRIPLLSNNDIDGWGKSAGGYAKELHG